MVPAQNIVKESAKIASVAIAAPATPIAAPVQNPPRRPIRAIKKAAGIVASIVPVICNATGRVDSVLSATSKLPTIAAVVPRMLLPVIAKDWHSASRRTVRRAGTVAAMLEMPVAGGLDCDRLSHAIDRTHACSGFDPADHRDRHAELRG